MTIGGDRRTSGEDGGRPRGDRVTAGEGQIYFNARYYDPTTGRFLTEDPSRKGVNWYAYCENNPVNITDPSGRDPVGANRVPQPLILGAAGARGFQPADV
jgi:RHS repeat-associated protein